MLIQNMEKIGIQVVSMQSLENVTLGGTGGWANTGNGWNNAVPTLYQRAQNYLNSEYATFARSIGSNPNGVFSDTAIKSGYYSSIPSCKYINTGTCLDWEKCEELNLQKTGFEYFYAWRCIRSEWLPGALYD